MFSSPWRNWLRRLALSIQMRGQRRPPRSISLRRFRPRLERLEDRVVPTVTTLTNYNGINFGQSSLIQANTVGGGATPPDPQGAVGPNSYIEAVNLTFAIFSPKTSGINPVTDAIDDFFNYQGNLPDPNPNDPSFSQAFSDPGVIFDDQTQRFIISCMEVDPSSAFGTNFGGDNSSVYDFAVSKSSNPLTLTSADWNFYQVNTTEAIGTTGTNYFSDFPGNLGYNDGALVVTLNEIDPSSPNQSTDHVLVNVINMSDVTNGVPQANVHIYQSDFQGASLRPTVMHDSTSVNDPMWFVQEHPGGNDLGDGQHIDVVRMDNVLSSTPTYTTTTLAVNPYTDVSLTPPLQADGSVVTPDLDSRILKAAERNGLLVATHSVSVSSTEDDAQWYAIDVSSGTPTLQQQGDVSGGNNTYVTYPGIDINQAGDIGMSYMQSGTDNPTDWLSMYVTGRTPTDPSGTMETPVLAQAGQQVYEDFGPTAGSDQRAGDLSGINVDAQGNFWAINEFADNEPLPTTDSPSADWGTNITSFTFDPVADLTVTASGPATVTPGGNATYTITLTNNGPNAAQNVVLKDILPAGAANASITPTSNPDGFSFTLLDGVFTSNSVTVANGDQDTFTITVSVPSSLGSGVIFDDIASVESTTTDPNAYDNAATVTGSTGQSITISANYNAVSYGSSAALLGGIGSTPPDNEGAVGPNSFVEAVNDEVAIFTSRTSAANAVTDSLDDFFATQGNLPDPNPNDEFGNFITDPFVVFDEQTQRFIVGCIEVDPGPQFTAQSTGDNSSVLDFAVSKTSNPTALKTSDWYFYQIRTTETDPTTGINYLSDYPGNVGYNGGALVVTLNEMSPITQNPDHVLVNAINLSDLANGVPQASLRFYQSDFQGMSLRPTTMHDSTSVNDPMWFVQEHLGADGLPDNQHIDVVRMDNVLSSTPTYTTTTLAVNPYSQIVGPLQPDGSMVTSYLDSRIMKVAEQGGTLVAAHSVSNAAGNQDLVQWYQISVNGSTPVLQQQGDLGAGPNTYLYFPGIDINPAGDIGMSYMQSGTDNPNDFLSMYVTGRTPSDPRGTMEAPVLAQAGLQVYEDYAPAYAVPQRAGDLSGINVDSSGNFWAINEYADDEATPTTPDDPVSDPNNPAADWGTNIVSFSLPPTSPTNVYIVTSTADDGSTGTLRDAINQVNAGKYTEINFNIAGTGVQKISLTSALPALTASGVFINGQSENQFQGSASTSPLIEVNGSSAGSSSDGLLLQGSNDIVSGLIIQNFSKNGIEVNGANDTIGGTAAGAGNIISGNTNDGVLIDSGISGVLVQGNFIGTNVAGSAALANSVGIEVAGSNNTIGGAGVAARNLISGNSHDGVLIDSTASGVLVQGNYIGVNAGGSAAVANGNGIEVAGNNNTLGASYAVAPNVISGNSNDGVLLDSGASGNEVLGSYIGTNPGGTVALANKVGIEDAGSSNTIGGSVLGARNVISGNTGDGVLNDSSTKSETIEGNYIGLNIGGNTALANGSNGIEIKGTGNTIGGNSGSNYYVRNFIAGNSKDGVLLDSGASGNQVLGNFIGIGVSGTTGVGNVANAIEIASNSNTVGGPASGYRNVISGSGNDGVLIDSTGASNLLQGNYVGTDYTGQKTLANSGSGIEIQGTGNTLGGTASGAGSIIAGNSKDGVRIGSSASGTLVQGNSIGVNASGAALGNGGNGLNIASNSNTVGGTVTAARNIISGNTSDGVLIASGASGNKVLGNFIGTNAAGTAALANSIGIEVAGNSNTIGGASGSRNLISGNTKDGVKIDSGGSGNLVLGNAIGVNTYDSAALGNGNGVEVAGNSNTIGASYAAAPNQISGNSNDGVLLASGSSANQVLGNYIGTNHAGTAAVANKVGIEDAGSSNIIGGSVLGARNVISGNTGDGVLNDSTAKGEVIEGNYIGVNVAGSTALANGSNGVEIQGVNNTLGGNSGSNDFIRNFIAGNGKDGVLLDSGASGNQVLGNFIGVGLNGSSGAGNVANAIEIAGGSNTIGSTVSGSRNVISNNGNDGVLIDSTGANNLIQGNYVGTDYTGTKAVANSGNGIEIQGTGNTVGGASGSRNLISGNAKDGVKIDSGGSGNVVLGNAIGVNTYDSAALGNGNGVEVAGNSNTIGASYAVAPNEISGNSNDGVLLASGSSGNQVLGNYIGTNHAGTAAVANKVGIEDAGSSNTIGGSVLGARNVISGNTGDGVQLDSTATAENMWGNYIGLNVVGNTALANSGNGVEVQGTGNTIGGNSGADYFTRNFIAGNSKDGVLLDSGASGNQVLGNFIGVGVSGTTGVGNVANAIEIASNSNTIGGTTSGYRNVLSGSGNDGVLIDSTGANNLLEGNFVGTDYTGTNAVANSGNGVEVAGNNNTLGGTTTAAGNIISGSSKNGVLLSAGSGNTIRHNSIFANAGLGISLASGANNNIAAPILSSVTLNGSTLTVQGSFTPATANVSYVLEFFASPSNDAEGKYYLGSLTLTPTSTNAQAFTFTTTTSVAAANPLITATLTDASGDTSAFSGAMASTAVLTYHNDNSSTGQDLTETILTPSNVNSSTFGKLFATSVDGQVYAQPLYDPGVNITTGSNQGTHNVVFVATQHDSLYAIDGVNGAILWHDTLLHAVHGGTVTSVPNGDVNSSDITPEIGVTATPVIDPSTNILYIEAKTKEVASDGNHYIHQLYAINISNGSYVNGSPIVIADTIKTSTGYTYVSGPTVNGTGDGSSNGILPFNALRQMERPALTEANGNIYLAFASHGDNGPYHGWVLSYSVSTLTLNGVFCTTPNGGLGGIWQGGDRLPVDASGNLYFETGNGTFETTLNSSGMPVNGDYGDSFVKIAVDPTTNQNNQNINGWGLKAVDYFTPFDQNTLNNNDWDLGSGGPILLPDSVGSTAHPHLLVGSGKEGRIYLIDRDNMGHYSSTTDNVVEETNNTTITGSFGAPAYYNGTIYYVGGSNIGNGNDVGKTFSIANGQMSLTPTSQGPDQFGYPGDTPSISANGATNGIVWATDHGTSQLRAYNATGFNTELYTSAQAANNRDALTGSVVKFAVPTVADGLVFVGSSNALNAYGLLTPATQPPAAPSNLTAATLSGTSIQLTWKDNATYPNTASGFHIEESTDGVNFTQVATASAGSVSYTVGGLKTSTAYTFRVRAFNNIGNSAYSGTASATTSSKAPNLDFSTGFANASSLLTFNGSAKVNGTALQLTDGNGNEAGSAFSTSQVDITHFNTQFSFQLSAGTSTADGFTFCIQTAGNTALGGTGGALGYQGIASSVAIKFDLYNNNGEGADSTGLYTDGAAPFNVGSIDLTNTGIDLHSGDQINVSMTYDGTTLTVTESDPTVNKTATQSYTINIANTVGSGTAFVGFTGGTGGLTAVQDILNWTYTSTSPAAAPVAPINSTATAVSATEANLTWTNYASNQTGFHIDRATDPAFTQNLVTQTAAADVTSFVDPGLTVGTTYYYRVRAFNALGDSPNSNSTGAILPTLPAAVSNLTVTNAASNEIDLSWTNNAADAASIQVFRKFGGNAPILIASLSPTTTSFADTGLVVPLQPGTTYIYNVHAMNAAGPSLVTSVTATTASNNPALQLTNGGANEAGSAATISKVNTANFSFQLPNRNVDGSTSTTPGNSPAALSPAGGSLGDGLNQKGGVDPVGLYINGAAPANVGSVNQSGTGMNPYSGDTFNARMPYNGTSFMVETTDASTEESATEDTLSWTYRTTTT